MTDRLKEKVEEFARLGATYAGTARLTSWGDSAKGLTVGFRLDDRDAEGDPLLHTHPFKGLHIGAKDGQRFALVAIMLADPDTEAVPGPASEPAGAPEEPTPGRQPEADWASLPYPTRAGIRCNDPDFHTFMAREYQVSWDAAFEKVKHLPAEKWGAELTIIVLREKLGVKSRAEITPGSAAAKAFDAIDSNFRMWIKYEKDRAA
jgi:hypothetical protein